MDARVIRFIPLAVAGGLLVPLLPAQSSVPQSYTLTTSSSLALEAMSGNPVEAKVSRFGPREFVDVTVAPQAGHSKPIHARHWFDLVAHRSEEHTSELQSLRHLVCRLLL